MKILRLIDSLDTRDGGPPQGVRKLDAALRSRGHQVLTLAMHKRGQVIDTPIHEDDVIVPALRFRGRGISITLLRRALAESRDADVVIVHGFYLWHDVVAGLVARYRGLPLVLQPHGVFERYQRLYSTTVKRLYDRLFGIRVLATVSAAAVASRAEVVGMRDILPSVHIAVVGIGVDICEKHEGRRPIHEPIALLSLSRIAAKKRIDVSITALSILQSQGIDATLSIAGHGTTDLEKSLRLLSRSLGVVDRVTWLGHVSGLEKAQLLERSDILLLPSENENFAISVAEAMAAGLPCVVTRAVAVSEYVGMGAGVVIQEPDPERMAEAVQKLVATSSIFGAASRRAREVAVSEFGWLSVAVRWEEVMNEAMKVKVDKRPGLPLEDVALNQEGHRL